MKLTPDKKLAVRSAKGWRVFDLGDVYAAEDRIAEVALVTPHKAPELLAFFNKVWLKVDEIVRLLEMEVVDAKQAVAMKRSEVILDRAEAIFKEKQLKASADLRQAVVDADVEYRAVLDVQNSLEAAAAFLKGKQKGVEMAYGSVRKILGESTYNMRNDSNNAITNNRTPVGGEISADDSPRSAYGRYNIE